MDAGRSRMKRASLLAIGTACNSAPHLRVGVKV